MSKMSVAMYQMFTSSVMDALGLDETENSDLTAVIMSLPMWIQWTSEQRKAWQTAHPGEVPLPYPSEVLMPTTKVETAPTDPSS
jgi:hypothetical protein